MLEGEGPATHIRNVNQEGAPALVIAPPPAGGKKKAEDYLWRVMLSKLRITGNEKGGPGIVARRVNEIQLQSVTVSHHGGDGILLDTCYEDPRINDCLVTYNRGAGLNLVKCHDIVVSANQFEENLDAVRCFGCYNLAMTGNNVDDHTRHGVVLEESRGSVVSSNMLEQSRGWAVLVDRDTYGVTLSANIITYNPGGGIDLRDAHGCTVSANTFSTMPRYPLLVEAGSSRVTIVGNTFNNAYLGEGKIKTSAAENGTGNGLTLRGARGVTITGNTFGEVAKAVTLEGEPSRGVLFAHNTLIASPSDHDRLQESVVEGNLIIEAGTAGSQ